MIFQVGPPAAATHREVRTPPAYRTLSLSDTSLQRHHTPTHTTPVRDSPEMNATFTHCYAFIVNIRVYVRACYVMPRVNH